MNATPLPGVRATTVAFAAFTFGLWTTVCASHADAAGPSESVAVVHYDARRDAAADIESAVASARTTRKRVLLNIGGDWCKDCRDLDAMFAADPALAALRDERYIVVKVFTGSENRNDTVLARYPKLNWVPTLIELDEAGRAVRAAPSTQFHVADELNPKLDPARVRAFLAAP